MKLIRFFLFCFLFTLSSCEKIKSFVERKTVSELQTEEEKASYLIGYILSENTRKTEDHLKTLAFLKGVQDNIQNKPPVLSDEDMQLVRQKLKKQADLKKQKIEGEKNKMEGKQFLKENQTKKAVQVTESGLQYEVLNEGKGVQPKEDSQVEVHYRGTFINGVEFDSSYKRNQSIAFPLNRVIKGWTEGLQLMKEGAKYKFYIPSDLAYGSEGSSSIPPHSVLIFEVELLKVK